MELLDPEQNSSFLDHYLDVAVDLSKVLFVCTCNSLDTIPAPLLDRMEIIKLSGYVAEEKMSIAENYLEKQSLKESGLDDYNVKITKEALDLLIKNYCRENGVRNLKLKIDKIYRKAALMVVQELKLKPKNDIEIIINAANLKEFVGSQVFSGENMYGQQTPPGVVMGLAWTSMGGSSLYIESVVDTVLSEDSKPSFHRTGQMGDVMKESSFIAYTVAKSFLAKHYPENTFFQKASIHLHVPEGATPKDGNYY